MEIVLFKDVTTESTLVGLEQLAKTYEGLYVDMNNAEERKYVKDKAHDIKFLLKTIDSKRIAVAKEFKAKVEKEAGEIIDRLKVANEPFTLLIDEHKAERAKVLAAEKLTAELHKAVIDKEDDHEYALLMNKTWAFDRSEVLRLAKEQADTIRKDAELLAEARQIQINESNKQDIINAENARLADVKHVANMNRNARDCLMGATGLNKNDAQNVIKAIAQNKISSVTINY